MMKYVAVIALMIIAVSAQQQRQQQGGDEITAYSFDNEGTGNFRWNYATSDGSSQDATGTLKKNPDPKGEDIQNIAGSFSFKTPEGKTVNVQYIADEGGYKQKTTFN